jgi:hypothetical protein
MDVTGRNVTVRIGELVLPEGTSVDPDAISEAVRRSLEEAAGADAARLDARRLAAAIAEAVAGAVR